MPENPNDVETLKALQRDVHDAFKEMVRDRRAGKLKAEEDELFSGEFWTGRRALALGLIDGIGELTAVMQERYGERVRFRPVTGRQSILRRRLGILGGTGPNIGGLADELIGVVEERALWSRFGL